MKYGLMMGATAGSDPSVDGHIQLAQEAERRGFHQVWMANIFGFDAINLLALVGRETESIRLGTAVVPTYPRHPIAIAQQALTTQAACGGRFDLGIGLSHQLVIEGMFGYSYDKPALHMKEYLQVLAPLLRGEPVQFEGEQYKGVAELDVPGGAPVPLLVAALGPRMLDLCGELTDGTITWMTGPKTLETHTTPKLRDSAERNRRPAPRVVAGFPVAVTDDVDAAKASIAEQLAVYGQLPSYRAMLDIEGVDGPADLAIVGDEETVKSRILALEESGVTDLDAAIVPVEEGGFERTLDLLTSLL